MAATTAKKDLSGVTVNYSVDDGEPHFFSMYPRNPAYGGTGRPHQVSVLDARAAQEAGRVDFFRNGLQLIPQPTRRTPKEFYNMMMPATDYYDEICSVVKKALGATYVHSLAYHQVRNQDMAMAAAKGDPMKPYRVGQPVAGYAAGPHTDYSIRTADDTFLQAFADKPELHNKKGRYIIVGTWRNIGEPPIQQDHLALLDATSVTLPDDTILADLYLQPDSPVYHQYRLSDRNVSRHTWWYYPDMTRDELLIFKQFDSDPKSARFTFHSSIHDPNTITAPPRESLEFRCVAWFPAEENSCPPPPIPRGDVDVDLVVRQILGALDAPGTMDRMGGLTSPEEILSEVIKAGIHHGYFGMKGISQEKAEEITVATRAAGFNEKITRLLEAKTQQSKL